MNEHSRPEATAGDVITQAAAWLVWAGIITMALFPLALPGIILVVAAVVPLLILALPLALVGAVVAAVGRRA